MTNGAEFVQFAVIAFTICPAVMVLAGSLPEYRDDNQLLRLYITYLRKKIEPDPANPRYILTERGVGYRFMSYK